MFQRIWLFIQYIFFLLFGRSFVFVDDTIKNRTFLKYAMLLPKNTKKFCNGMPCYGAMKSIVQLGVLQFKDIKYFLKSNRAAEAQRYYEDNAPSNVFYNRRYLVAKEVANQFIADFIENKAFSPINFLPIYTDTMCGYYLKIDQLYNYLKDTNKVLDSRTNTILKESFWENRSDSLFNYSTIVYNGSYFVDPSTYGKDEKPLYNFVFPQGTGKSSKDFYLK